MAARRERLLNRSSASLQSQQPVANTPAPLTLNFGGPTDPPGTLPEVTVTAQRDNRPVGDTLPEVTVTAQRPKKQTIQSDSLGEDILELLDPTGISSYDDVRSCLLYTSPSPRDQRGSRMPSSA